MKDPLPLKWVKYLLLAQHDLTTMDRLEKEVRRFGWENREDMIAYLTSRFKDAQSQRESLLIVVKFVAPNAVGALPNFRISDATALPLLKELVDHPQKRYTEVWCCETRVEPNRMSVAGRILFQDAQPEVAQHVEQVWRVSPRMIEELAFGERDRPLPFPYIRAQRPSWSWQFRIARLYRPNECQSSSQDIEREFHLTMALMERQKRRVEQFLGILHEAGASAITLEYKADGDEFWFIDWDTAIDQQILSRVYHE